MLTLDSFVLCDTDIFFARETQNIHNNVTSTPPGVMSSVYILEKTVIIRP